MSKVFLRGIIFRSSMIMMKIIIHALLIISVIIVTRSFDHAIVSINAFSYWKKNNNNKNNMIAWGSISTCTTRTTTLFSSHSRYYHFSKPGLLYHSLNVNDMETTMKTTETKNRENIESKRVSSFFCSNNLNNNDYDIDRVRNEYDTAASSTTITKSRTYDDSPDIANTNTSANHLSLQSSKRKLFQPIIITENTNKVPSKPISAAPITKSLYELQKTIAGPIVASFGGGILDDDKTTATKLFQPLITNCHVQTIGGFLLRQKGYGKYVTSYQCLLEQILDATVFNNNNDNNNSNNNNNEERTIDDDHMKNKIINENSIEVGFWDHREKVLTPDGDWFHADTKYASCFKNDDVDISSSSSSSSWLTKVTAKPTVLLLHGLNSNSKSALSIDIAKAITESNMNCICLNFRGCSGPPNDTLRFYHFGFTDDIHYYIKLLNERWLKYRTSSSSQTTPPMFYLSGFSLGANTALKCLGELGERATSEYNVYGGAVLCAPLDNVRNTQALEQPGINKSIYTKKLLNGLKDRVRTVLDRFCDGDINTSKFDYQRVLASRTITEFDDAFTAQIHGFDDCWDYYSQTSSIHYLDSIAVPTMILNAKDDPFFDPSVWPIEKSYCSGVGTAPIKFIRTEHGGHLGFAFHQVPPDDDRLLRQKNKKDMNNKAAAAATTTAVRENESRTQAQSPPPCWGSSKVAEFLWHVQNHESTNLLRKVKENE